MRILIVTGIFEPEIGGPATFAAGIARKLCESGSNVTVLTYSNEAVYDTDAKYQFRIVRVKRGNRLLNRARLFFAVLRESRRCNLIYTLDWFAAGLPVALAAQLRRIPYVVRVGGDYLWEQRYLESGKQPVTLKDFYGSGMYQRSEYKVFYRLIRYVLARTRHVVFNSNVQRELYMRFYGLTQAHVSTIFNPVPRAELSGVVRGNPTHEFVFWGRLIVMKNIETLIRAFTKAKLPDGYTLTLIGNGPQKKNLQALAGELGLGKRVVFLSSMSRSEVIDRVKNCRACIVPSWTDISPNQVYECLAIGLPALVTAENYLSIRDQLPEVIDPRSADDIAAKLEMLADDAKYADFVRRFNAIRFDHTWDAALREHRELFERIVKP